MEERKRRRRLKADTLGEVQIGCWLISGREGTGRKGANSSVPNWLRLPQERTGGKKGEEGAETLRYPSRLFRGKKGKVSYSNVYL